MSSQPHIFRLLTLGDSGAGKSSLLLRYTQGEFATAYMPTIGIDFRLKNVELGGKMIKVQVWDTAGQERFRTITHNYYRGAHGIALVYDCTNESSFANIKKWIQDVHTYAESDVDVVLIGNKCDLAHDKEVTAAQGEALAAEFDIKFFESSAKMDINVHESFTTLVEQVATRLFEGEEPATNDTRHRGNTVAVGKEAGGSSGFKCCK